MFNLTFKMLVLNKYLHLSSEDQYEYNDTKRSIPSKTDQSQYFFHLLLKIP